MQTKTADSFLYIVYLVRIISVDAAVQTVQLFLLHPSTTLNQKITYNGFEVVKQKPEKKNCKKD
jgi:hypothetical protein